MEAADIKKAASVAGERLRSVGSALGRSPAAALLTAVAVGFLGGLVLRCFERPKKSVKDAGV